MERLKKLEQVQKMMMFMESQGIISLTSTPSPSDSHRFLADFLLFMMEPCGKLSFDDKCRSISQHLPKISSPLFLEQALGVLPEERTSPVSDSPPTDQVKKNVGGGDCLGSEASSIHRDVALIGLDAMQRANSTLEDFCRSYFMFHNMDAKRPEVVFKYLPVLFFTESYIYQLDTLNEKMVHVCRSSTTAVVERSGKEADSTWACLSMKTIDLDPFKPLTLLLEHHGLLTEHMQD